LKPQKTYIPYNEKGKWTGIEVGESDPKKNTWKLIRIYDKIRDSEKKGKMELYGFDEK